MNDIDDILKKCLLGDRRAQTQLVNYYAKKLMPVCKRYALDNHAAEDALQETFINTFRYLKTFAGKGSFDAWIRRIAVNCSLNFNKKISFAYKELDNMNDYILPPVEPEIYDQLDNEELLELIKELPEHYYLVFNLYVIEGYDHKEIGELLSIGESTSRSNLSRARMKLIEILKKKQENEFSRKIAI